MPFLVAPASSTSSSTSGTPRLTQPRTLCSFCASSLQKLCITWNSVCKKSRILFITCMKLWPEKSHPYNLLIPPILCWTFGFSAERPPSALFSSQQSTTNSAHTNLTSASRYRISLVHAALFDSFTRSRGS